ncbi:hypothetical protein HU200_040941 [Digitaria exilis]|uniref:Pectinesterase inhibitor domain-containing protein n=1 Tax=Digitaria exilis TaxID=1010633 RepID=A0A835EJI2_9POAL|nr:hypothetical protein HU200_040941 [Digitaria exilis]
MAMARSLATAPLLLLLLSVLVATASAARAVGGGGDAMQDACSKSQFPKVCADGLATKPESQTATPRELAAMFVGIAVEKGQSMGASIVLLQGRASGDVGSSSKDKAAIITCYDSCSDDVDEALAHLDGLLREPVDAKFLELKSWLSSTLGGTSTCEDACKDIPKTSDREQVVAYSVEFEKLLRVALDLITQASGSMSADIALPPSDASAPAAYGAAAPPLASSSSATAEAPAAASEGPSSSSSAASSRPAAAADSPAADGAAADAPSSGGSASAPAPSGSASAAADAPSSGSSSGADAPSGGETDAPAPDDGASGDDGSDDSDDKA